MLHAGSVAKGTALSGVHNPDTAVYVKTGAAPTGNDSQLVPWLADRLYEANTNMSRDQFLENEHWSRSASRGRGSTWTWCRSCTRGTERLRVPRPQADRAAGPDQHPLHLRFIRERKSTYGPDFAQLIRLTKWWKRVTNDRVRTSGSTRP